MEELSNPGHVVQGKNEFAAQIVEPLRKLHEVVVGEIKLVQLASVVGGSR